MEIQTNTDSHTPMILDEKVIAFLIEKILKFEFDGLLDFMIVTDPPEQKDQLHELDKFYIARIIWRDTINGLYEKYLPGTSYSSKWTLEISPYTLTLSTLISDNGTMEIYRQKLKRPYSPDLTNDDLAKKIKDALLKLEIDPSNFSEALKKCMPSDELDQYALLCRIMAFPPLEELAIFYKKVFDKFSDGLNSLLPIFGKKNKEATQLPAFTSLEPFNDSVIPFTHKVYAKYGLAYFESHPYLSRHQKEFEEIRRKAVTHKDTFVGTFICSCCGTEQSTTVPIEILEYKFLLEHRNLVKEIGFTILKDIIEEYQISIANSVSGFIKNINSVDNPRLLILVEGASEEIGIPFLAFRRRFLLFQHKIFVYNSGSKELLLRDFKAFKKKYTKLKIICLLDKDAVKEKDEIDRMIKDKRHKYELFYLDQGTWEDIFPIDCSIDVLNRMYPEGDEITILDFDSSMDFNQNMKSLLFAKKKANFDKVKFSSTIALQIEMEKIPQVIIDVLNTAEKFIKAEEGLIKSSDKE